MKFFLAKFLAGGDSEILVYATWQDNDLASYQLHIFANIGEAIAFLPRVLEAAKQKYMQCFLGLSANREKSFSLQGALAATFVKRFDHFCHSPALVLIPNDKPSLCGLVGNTDIPQEGAAILWYTPMTGYHATLVYSHRQALDLIGCFSWHSDSEKKILSTLTQLWRLSPSDEQPRQIEDSVARLLCQASLAWEANRQTRA